MTFDLAFQPKLDYWKICGTSSYIQMIYQGTRILMRVKLLTAICFFPADPIVLLLTTCFLSRTIPTFIGNLRLLEILQLGTYFFVKLLQENISFAVCSSY